MDAGEIIDEDLVDEDKNQDEASYTSEEVERAARMTSADGDEFGWVWIKNENKIYYISILISV